jgi:hypothetical protein
VSGQRASFLDSKKPLAIVIAAALAALGGLLVSRYVPGLLERVEKPSAVEVDVDYDSALYASCGWSAVLPTVVEGTALPDPGGDVLGWVLDSGGAPLGETHLRLLLRGTRTTPAQVTGMTTVVAERSPPLTGSRIVVPCDGEVEAIALGIDLDEPNPAVRRVEDGELTSPFFSGAVISLEKDESVPVSLAARTEQSHVSWQIQLSTMVDGTDATVTPTSVFVTSAGPEPGPQDWYLLAIDGLAWWNDEAHCEEFDVSLSGAPCP